MENNKLRERILVSVSPVTPVYPTMQQKNPIFGKDHLMNAL